MAGPSQLASSELCLGGLRKTCVQKTGCGTSMAVFRFLASYDLIARGMEQEPGLAAGGPRPRERLAVSPVARVPLITVF